MTRHRRLADRVITAVRHWLTMFDVGDERDCPRDLCRCGALIIAIVFGLFGTWAVVAPLNGAVVATGQVKVDGNRKAIQHPDGGTVLAVHVKDGEKVRPGDVLIELDRSQAQAEVGVLEQQYLTLRFAVQRLQGESVTATRLARPADVVQPWSATAENLWRAQADLFDARRRSADGQRAVITEKISQLSAEIKGGEAQVAALGRQLASLQGELKSLAPLVESGIVARPRYLQLERSAAAIEGQAAEVTAIIARARQAIAEQQRLSLQIGIERSAEVARDLQDLQSKLAELAPKLGAARSVLDHTTVRSPYSGTVVALAVFSVGGYVGRGEKMLDIVPASQELIVEAMVNVDDIADVHPGSPAQVRLSAYSQRTHAALHGTVQQIAADRLTDNRTGNPYYTAVVAIEPASLADMPDLKLYPGMPATVTIPTVSRSAFQYAVGPLSGSFNKAFREK